MINYIYFGLFLFFKSIILFLPHSKLVVFLKALGSFLYFLNLKHRRIIMKNLDLSFGDNKTKNEKEEIAKKCYQNFLIYIANFIEVSNKDLSYLDSITKVENEHYLQDALKKGEKVILISAHFGAWELILQKIGAHIAPITTIREDIMSSALLNETLIKYRGKNNVEAFYKEGALIGIVKALKKGRIIAYLVDQNFKQGVEVSFFGKPIKHIQSASQLSRKFDALLVPVFCTTDDYQNYTIKFQEPFKCAKTDNEERDIFECTQKQSTVTQKMIESRPSDYFWFHKKFKSTHRGIYKNL